MKYSIFLLALLCSATLYADPLLVATFMIKNEAPVIEATLTPYVACGIDSFFIFDTGSTDNTLALVKNFFAKYPHITLHIAQEPFIDFATSRNRALELTEQAFPTVSFILMPDAEWLLEHGDVLLRFCQQEKEKPSEDNSFLIMLSQEEQEFYTPRLFRAHCGIQFHGAVHEAPMPPTFHKVSLPMRFTMKASDYGCNKTQQRLQRDVELLLKDYKENPEAPRTLFYLAQTYQAMGDLENAYLYYKKRAHIAGYYEENAIAWHRLGYITELLATTTKSSHSWQEAFTYYMASYHTNPHRAESLTRIARHYAAKRDWHQAYFFAKLAAQIPYPINDSLFIEKEAYHYSRYDILGKSSHHVGDRATEKWTLQQLYKKYPSNSVIDRRLTNYQKQ